MSKFKVGDRVRAIADEDGEGKGKTAVIIEMCHPEWAHVRFEDTIDGWGEDGQEWGISTSKLVPVAEATGTATDGAQADKPKLKVGDRVRVTDPRLLRTGTPVGAMGTITEIEGRVAYFELEHPECGKIVQMLYDAEEYLELLPATRATGTLTIQPGKFYITRDGRKVGPMVDHGTGPDTDRWRAYIDGGRTFWSDNGAHWSYKESPTDLIAEWSSSEDAHHDNASTAGFTVPLFDEDDFDICGHRDNDDDIVQLSVSELTAALADSLKVARKVGKTIKRGDMVMLARHALVTGIDRYHASVQTDGGNYSLPLAALTAA